jgi:hypothetical protein
MNSVIFGGQMTVETVPASLSAAISSGMLALPSYAVFDMTNITHEARYDDLTDNIITLCMCCFFYMQKD